jgi:hypothetical protein
MSEEVYAFTGPARTLSEPELDVVVHAVKALEDPTELRSGGAPGVDTAAAVAFFAFQKDARKVLVVPDEQPFNTKLLALPWDEVVRVRASGSPSNHYMARNEVLVGPPTTHLLAFPETPHEVNRSGTWATVRRARRRKDPEVEVTITPLVGSN